VADQVASGARARSKALYVVGLKRRLAGRRSGLLDR